jgi:coenzyme F420-0:L-glutamate ligase/coenzyme F420-1:gamma-L-glutamate ligase
MITIFAPDGIGEVAPDTDLADVVLTAIQSDPGGPLADGDIVVVTSKIISKAEGRTVPAPDRAAAIRAETTRTVARRGVTAIVRNRRGLTLAAAGVDNSNVDPELILLLPEDPDASAEGLRAALQQRTGLRLGLLISDTAGRAWRVGQTDHAIGAAGVLVRRSYAGEQDGYGNRLEVTEMALADELAAAADLAKGKLGGRPVAVIRGLPDLVVDSAAGAETLVRPPAQDMFGFGSAESVLAAALAASGRLDAYEDLVRLDGAERHEAVIGTVGAEGAAADLLRRMLSADLSETAARLTPR